MDKTPTAGAALVQHLFDAAFTQGRMPRSPEYRAGVRAWLDLRANGTPYMCPYAPASASFDAFYAGVDEGRVIWRTHLDEKKRSGGAAHTLPDGA